MSMLDGSTTEYESWSEYARAAHEDEGPLSGPNRARFWWEIKKSYNGGVKAVLVNYVAENNYEEVPWDSDLEEFVKDLQENKDFELSFLGRQY